ncbi:MAG: EAL domain-containing protein [Sulfurimonas sp.]|nr:EAL domain-containing protein [Sulfurimonas sp.]
MNNLHMRAKHNTLLIVLGLLILSWGAGYQYLNYQLNSLIDNQFNNISTNTHKIFILTIQQKKKNLESKLERVISISDLTKAVLNKDNKKIELIIKSYYRNLNFIENENEKDKLIFRSTDGAILYHNHNIEVFNNNKKVLIIDINAFNQTYSGFEVGKSSIIYRVIKPIFYNNKYIGSVELELPINKFIQDTSSLFKIEIGVAINKSMLENIFNKSKQIFIPIGDRYLLTEGSDKLKEHILKNSDKSSELYKIDNTILLENHLGEISGYFILGYDISSLVKKDKEFMYRLFFMIIIMSFAICLVLYFSFKKIFAEFKKQAYTDYLTGLANRESLECLLMKNKLNLLILSNIKDFSLLNEIYGIKIANKILIKVAKAFEKFSKENNFNVYRISADEFVLVKFEDNFEVEEYLEIIEKLHNYINSLIIKIDLIDEVIGIEIYSGISVGYEYSLAEAQMALKKVKENSLSYLAYSQKVDRKQHSKEVVNIKKILRHALKNNNIIPFFQPITNKDGKIIKYEALVRIIEHNNNEERILTPNEFLSISIHSGLYIKIAISMIKQSLDFFIDKDKKISINLLPSDFFNATIMKTLKNSIKKFGATDRIVLEVIEQDNIENFDRLINILNDFKKQGVLIAIDDFGSGYANYTNIIKVKPDYIKIDGSLIRDILVNKESKILVKSIVNFAKELGIITVAEYVENKEIFELLKEYGVDEYQGYYFGKPKNLLNK